MTIITPKYQFCLYSTKQRRDSEVASCNVIKWKIHSCLAIYFCRHVFIFQSSIYRCGNFKKKNAYISLSAINEFPKDVFTNKERQQGGILLHIIAVSSTGLRFYFSFTCPGWC